MARQLRERGVFDPAGGTNVELRKGRAWKGGGGSGSGGGWTFQKIEKRKVKEEKTGLPRRG